MKKSKAFTLVELLAIIIILTLLVLIATPLVSNVIADSKKNSFGITCQNIYNAVEKFAEFQADESCFVFDFEKDITNQETIDGVVYQPISKLQLKGSLPRKGEAKYCDGTIFLYADNGENTCLVNEETSNVITGTVEHVDITSPVLNNLTLTSTSSSIRVIVSATEEDGTIRKYFYSLNGIDYIESTSNVYTFEKLKTNTEYKVFVRVENASGLLSDIMKKSILTKDIIKNTPIISEDRENLDDSYTYAVKRKIDIEYSSENLSTAIRYFKSSVSAKVSSDTVVAMCGTTVTPGECIEVTTEYLNPGEWYKTNNDSVSVEYKEAGTLYATISDGTNLSGTATYVISDIDITEPEISVKITDVKTDRVTLNAICTDEESGITKYEFSKDGGKNWISNGTTNIYTFNKLTQGTEYEYSVRCTNGTGELTSTYNETKETEMTIAPEIINVSNIPSSGYNYFTNRTYKITYSNAGIVEPAHYVKANVEATVVEGSIVESCGNGVVPTNCVNVSVSKIVPGTWYKISGSTVNLSFTSNGTIYALTGDGTNISTTSTYIVSEIDTTKPDSVLSTGTIKTDRITLTATCSDDESDITKYEFSNDNGSTWVSNGKDNVYTFVGLKQNTEYDFAVKCTNGSSLTSTTTQKGKTANIINPSVANTDNAPKGGTHYTSRTYRVTYDNTNVNSASYYFKVASAATTASGVVIGSCGTGETPGTCTSSSVTNLVVNTWYKTTSLTPEITFKENGKLYAVTGDGTNFSNIVEEEIKNIDITDPEVSLTIGTKKTDRITLDATCEDKQSGIIKYEFSKDGGKNWIANGTTKTYTFTGLVAGDEYKFGVRCTNGASRPGVAYESDLTLKPVAPTFENTNNTPKDGPYYTSRTYKITYNTTNNANPIYYFKSSADKTTVSGTMAACGTGTNPGTCSAAASITTLVANTWYKASSSDIVLTYTRNGNIYAVLSDGTNFSTQATYTVTDIDPTEIIADLETGNINTDRVTLTANCTAGISGITKYEFSKDGGSNWISNGTTKTYTFTKLTSGKEYNFGVRCTNGAKVYKDAYKKATTITADMPTFTNSSNVPSSGYNYYTSRTYKITYKNTGVSNSEYYFKSSVAATVASGVVTGVCTTPGSCSTSNVTSLAANTWYKTENATPSITVAANGTLSAAISDGTNVISADTSITNIDTTTPNVTISRAVSGNRNVLTAAITPASNASGYTYEWYKGNSKISNATSTSYSTGEAGTFKIKVKTGSGIEKYSNELTINSYTITCNANGGTAGSIASVTKIQDLSATISCSTPTRSGYTFKGWGTSSSDTTVDYLTGSTYTANASTTLYAIWEIDYHCSTGELKQDSNGNYICVASNPVLRYTKDDYTRDSYYTSWSCSTNSSASSCTTSNSSTCSNCTSYTSCSTNPTTYTSWSCSNDSSASSCSASGSSSCSSCTSYTTCSTNPTTYTNWSCSTSSSVSSCSASGSSSCSSCTSYTTCSTNPTTYTNWSCSTSSSVSSCSASNSSSCSSCTSYTACSANPTTYTKSTYTRSHSTSGIKWCLSYNYSYVNQGGLNFSSSDVTTSCDGNVSSCTVCSPWTGTPFTTDTCQYCKGTCTANSSGSYTCTEKGYQCQVKVKSSTPSSCASFESSCHHSEGSVNSSHSAGFDYQTCSGNFYGSWSSPSISTVSSCSESNSSSCSSCTSYSTCSTNPTTYSKTSCTRSANPTTYSKQTCSRSTNPTTYSKYTCSRSANPTTYSKQTCSRSLEYTSWALSSTNSGLTTCSSSSGTLSKTECSSYYTCPSGWSTYSGNGSSMSCYKAAEK